MQWYYFDKITEKIKVLKGTEVSLKIKDKNKICFYNEESQVVVESIESQMIDSEIGYIYINRLVMLLLSNLREAYDNLVSKGWRN